MKVLLVHWNEAEAGERMASLKKTQFQAVWFGKQGVARTKNIAQFAPDIILIDLSRMPYLGKYVASAVRKAKRTRSTPLIFVDGSQDKVASVREAFPQDIYCTWKGVPAALKKVAASAPVNYSAMPAVSTPLARKLNFTPGRKVYLQDAPREFFSALTEVPEGLEFLERPNGADLGLLFYEDWDQLLAEWDKLVALMRRFPVWIAYRKGGTLKAHEIRAALKDSGLADYKVCAINTTWTGLLATVARKK